jgi:hypothetical protein
MNDVEMLASQLELAILMIAAAERNRCRAIPWSASNFANA